MKWRIEPLQARHERDGFDCGDEALNQFLRRYARQQQSRNLNRTYVALGEGENRVCGFYTVSAGSVGFLDLDPTLKLPRYPVPVMRIGRLGVDLGVQGRGLWQQLLADALGLAVASSEKVGIFAVVVDAKHDQAASFYRKLGFIACQDLALTLYLPIETLSNSLKH